MKFSPEKIATIYCEHLLERQKLENLRMISRFWNSFEGWAKWELAMALSNTLKLPLYPWTGSRDAEPNRIGVECRVQLDRRKRVTRELAKSKKQIDLWVENGGRNPQWHAIELKVVINNNNKGTQLKSWYQDHALLNSIKDTKRASAVAIVMAVGFSRKDFERGGYWIRLIAESEKPDTNPAWHPSVHLGILGCKAAPKPPKRNYNWFAGEPDSTR